MREIQIQNPTLRDLYYILFDSINGQVWNGSTFEELNQSNESTYAISLTEIDDTGIYFGNFPTAINTRHICSALIYQQLASPAVSLTTDVYQGGTIINWNGTTVESFDDIEEQLKQIRFKTDLIVNNGTVIIAVPIKYNQELDIERGDDYKGSRALRWTDTRNQWASLTNNVITFVVYDDNNHTYLTVTGSINVAEGFNKEVKVELTAAQTGATNLPRQSQYKVYATDQAGNKATLVKGLFTSFG